MIFEEKLIDSERIYEGAILNLRRDRVTTLRGEAYREIIEHNGAVAAVAITDEGNIVMVKQFRYAFDSAILEIPAGKIDLGEEPIEAMKRELKEETGYTAGKIVHMGDCNPSCAYSKEVIHIYFMTDLTKGKENPDEDEVIEVIEMPFMEVYDMAADGKLVDSKTMAALLMARKFLE